jgi:hypothetical protein
MSRSEEEPSSERVYNLAESTLAKKAIREELRVSTEGFFKKTQTLIILRI